MNNLTMPKLKNIFSIIFLIIIVLILFSVPLTGVSAYILRVLIIIFIYISLSETWNMFSGLSGYMNFGHTVYLGLGAYALALSGLQGLPLLLCFLISALICFLFAVCVGFPLLRIRGAYFAVSTLALMSIMRIIIAYLKDITGGGSGLTLEKLIVGFGYHLEYYYYISLIIVLGVTAVAYIFKRSKMGLGLIIIKEDEEVAESIGVNTTLYKVISYAISAAMTGIIGGFYAYYMLYIDPDMVFNVSQSIMVILMVILGGMGTIIGPIIGAALMQLLDSILRIYILEGHLIIYSCILLGVMLLKPEGITKIIEKYARRLSS